MRPPKAEPWDSAAHPPPQPPGLLGWGLAILRGLPLIAVIFVGLVILLVLRLPERLIFGRRRRWTPTLTQAVCRLALIILGIGYQREGEPLRTPGAVVANHASWLDIFALNAALRLYFVAKTEVAQWPGIGWLARATGTVFIRRSRAALPDQIAVFQDRLGAGHRLCFFPEGTSTDGLQVLAFKPGLFAAFLDPSLRAGLRIQPVSLCYQAPPGADPRFYGWWGDMGFAPHLLATLTARRQGRILVRFHPPIAVADFADRKALALALETQVRAGLTLHQPRE